MKNNYQFAIMDTDGPVNMGVGVRYADYNSLEANPETISKLREVLSSCQNLEHIESSRKWIKDLNDRGMISRSQYIFLKEWIDLKEVRLRP